MTPKRKRREKKLSETLAHIVQDWAGGQSIKLTFPEEARWHRSGALKAPQNIYLLRPPPYAPERNPIEHVWDELRETFFHNRMLESLDAQEEQLVAGLKALESNCETVRRHDEI